MATPTSSLRAERLPRSLSGWRDYASLAKPRVAGLLVLTCLAAMITAYGGLPPATMMLSALAGGLLVAGGAGALNCYLERDIDARMERTCHRPMPAGRLPPLAALVYGLALLTSGLAVLRVGAGAVAAGLALAGALYYVVVYTLWLKPRTEYNIVIGGLGRGGRRHRARGPGPGGRDRCLESGPLLVVGPPAPWGLCSGGRADVAGGAR